MGRGTRPWILAAVLLSVLFARLLYPMGSDWLRRETARILSADLDNMALVETVSRALAAGDWHGEWIAAVSRQLGSTDA